MDLSLTNTQLFTSQDFYWWTEVLVDYCDVFISGLDSHSDGTHSLLRIHWWASDAMLQFSNSVDKVSYIINYMIVGAWIVIKFTFWGELFLQQFTLWRFTANHGWNLFFLNPCILSEEHWTSSSVYVKKHKSKSTWAVYVYFIGILILKYLKCIQFIFGVNFLILL